MRKLISTLLILFICLNYSFSQANLQFYGSFVRNLNPDYKGNTYGGGLRLEFGSEDKLTNTYLGLGYNLAMKQTAIIEARAYSSSTNPSYVPVTATYTLPMYRLEAGSRLYLAGGAHTYEGINFYGQIGAELIVTPNKPSYSDFNRMEYHLGYTADSDVNEDGSEKIAINIMLAGGFGIEKNIGPGNIFLQGTIAFPATQSGSSDISSSIESFTPIPVNINLGFKIPIGEQ